MKKITMHGELAEKFDAEPIMLEVNNAVMMTRGLISRFGNEFRQTIRDGTFEILCIDKDGKESYVHDELTATMFIDADEIHITPVAQGSGRFGQIILGVILIIIGVYVPGAQAAIPAGIAMVAGGIVQLLTPVPNLNALSNERPDSRPSFVFNGAVNVYEQGGPVPLVYGRFKAGSVIVSAGFNVERLGYNVRCGPRYDGPGDDCTRGPRRSR